MLASEAEGRLDLGFERRLDLSEKSDEKAVASGQPNLLNIQKEPEKKLALRPLRIEGWWQRQIP